MGCCGNRSSVLCESSGESGVIGALVLGLVSGLPVLCLLLFLVQLYWFLSTRARYRRLGRRLRARAAKIAGDLDLVLDYLATLLAEGKERAAGKPDNVMKLTAVTREDVLNAITRFYGFTSQHSEDPA